MRVPDSEQPSLEGGEQPARAAGALDTAAGPGSGGVELSVHAEPVTLEHQQPAAAAPSRPEVEVICNDDKTHIPRQTSPFKHHRCTTANSKFD